MGNCVIAQSGGPTVAINATLAGIYTGALRNSKIDAIYGGINGIEGIMNEKIIDLEPILNKNDNLELLTMTPSAFLGSCRFKIKDECEIKRIFKVFEKFDIKYFFYIGGNDSMDTILRLDTYAKKKGADIKFIGVPKTIDNDLMGVDHTPGFGSSAKYIASVVKEVSADSYVYNLKSVTVIEVMGRNTGWLAIAAALARNKKKEPIADLIYIPEVGFDPDKFIMDIKEVWKRKQQVIVVISEGINDGNGNFISEISEAGKDEFGHTQMGGAGKALEVLIRQKLGVKARAIEINVLQRCASHMASATDIEESLFIGERSVGLAVDGVSGKMSGIRRCEGNKYTTEFISEDIGNIANREKFVPEEFLNEDKNNISKIGLEYLKPLVLGERTVRFEDGLPIHLELKDFC